MRRSKIGFMIVLILWLQVSIGYSEQEVNVEEAESKLEGISSDEKIVLEQLFLLSQEIDNLSTRAERLSEDIQQIMADIKVIDETIEKHDLAYQEMLKKLSKTLRDYQKRGANSYFELIFSSDSVKSFIQKLNILRDYTNSNKTLLDSLEERKEQLDLARQKKTQDMQTLELNKSNLKIAIQNKRDTKAILEATLEALKTERAQYETYLTEVQDTWNTLKPLFRKTVDAFSKLVVSERLPYDAIDLEFSLKGVRGRLSESVFNDILADQTELPKLIFEFHTDLMSVSIPEKKITLSGSFEIIEGHILKFIVTEGSFYGLPLEPDSIDELFSEGYMSIDLSYLLEGYKISTVTLKEKTLELYVKSGLF
ncbi:coiled-coil domain-containing protein [Fusibacter ferrireducens]|uniref:Peptidoglycan hydrolase PcsB coiled-coil domain-containing protein n=1 Tax=Fusibacter ferrireducens TaxID=2785058 RepID=A0ABR9ZQW2_9FIRM|nr:hypothetical protein [Fusibacter ferrireducens]MBF4692706.1 hypothetical protein [Fusibacter ferrireducens]